jgi:hypothetical protein
MNVQDIINRVQTELEDATGESGADWTDADYILGKLQTLSDDIAIRLQLLDLNYNTQEVILPNIPANTVDLSAYQASGGPLSQMILPKSIEWRLVGENQQEWQFVPQVDKVIDTDTGTGENIPAVNTALTGTGVTVAGSEVVADVNSVVSMSVGQMLTVDVSPNDETVEVLAITLNPPSFSAVFSMLHAANAIVTSSPPGVESDDPTVESYEYRGGIVKLSPCMEPVDLRIRFVATLISLSNNSQAQIIGLTNVYVYKCCEKITASRGVGTSALAGYFMKCYERSCADFEGLSVKSQQSRPVRLGGRRSASSSGWDSGWTPPIVNNG